MSKFHLVKAERGVKLKFMQSIHTYHRHKIWQIFHTDFWHFDLSIWLHVLARSLINVFVPILLLQIGYELKTVILYMMVFIGLSVPLDFVSHSLIKRLGAKNVLILAVVSIICSFVGLYLLKVDQFLLLFVMAFLMAVYDAFFWTSHLYLFEKINQKVEKIGEQTGILFAVKNLATMIGPAIGGSVLIVGGPHILIFSSIVVFSVSLIPLFQMKEIHDKPGLEEPLFRNFFKQAEEKINYLGVALFGVLQSAELYVWPVFIYLYFNNISSVAMVSVILSVTTIISSYFFGKAAKRDPNKLIALGALLAAIVWILRMIISTGFFYFASVFLMGVAILMMSVALLTRLFNRGREIGPLTAMTMRNAISMGGQFIFWLILALFVDVFGIGFIVATVAAIALIISSLAGVRLLREKASQPVPEAH
ncbi:MAG: hypothetical protein COU09_01880 [Candidatus Harrisonbacteria bacterium CG10_big_fil_rev_8_21_14_0_10_44_23]|uniref:Major facilitator superfamily (MFS) profile domain-containing protein n=1 Tax=Candidatus Harrisonbacteria bacterium CG10_big_fil_rev_8_21_14_0_10_44_23 TaxID=1974585 RepID=A0A2H0UQ25_9BACT|nr:MAG: hypothetical protein COU09_01880 [Candidatus Harrisonbacteria bacterium CG10_big_fil_rev_8_21_14_0_10_44_23]